MTTSTLTTQRLGAIPSFLHNSNIYANIADRDDVLWSLFVSVEEIMATAVTANAQLAVARSVVERQARAQGKIEAEVAAEMAKVEIASTE
jgi:hypothetical protein